MEQLKALKEEIRLVKKATIPKTDKKITDMAKSLVSTKELISNFNSRFDNVEKQQEEMVQHQAAGLENWRRYVNA
jgi:hypothetical protein